MCSISFMLSNLGIHFAGKKSIYAIDTVAIFFP